MKAYSVYKKRIDDFNAFMEMWKYDNLKTLFKNDKYNLEPIKYFFSYILFLLYLNIFNVVLNRQIKKILTDEVISMIKPKRMFVLCKGDSFYKINSKDKKTTKRKLILTIYICFDNITHINCSN